MNSTDISFSVINIYEDVRSLLVKYFIVGMCTSIALYTGCGTSIDGDRHGSVDFESINSVQDALHDTENGQNQIDNINIAETNQEQEALETAEINQTAASSEIIQEEHTTKDGIE